MKVARPSLFAAALLLSCAYADPSPAGPALDVETAVQTGTTSISSAVSELAAVTPSPRKRQETELPAGTAGPDQVVYNPSV